MINPLMTRACAYCWFKLGKFIPITIPTKDGDKCSMCNQVAMTAQEYERRRSRRTDQG